MEVRFNTNRLGVFSSYLIISTDESMPHEYIISISADVAKP
jgi:hypothetical protein